MQAMDDMALLREYARRNSEAAFGELVSRRIGFVYSSALRQVRDPHLAGEITQTVFIILAQKAGRISDKTILTGWFFRTTRFAALAQMRAEAKRSLRRATVEKEFQMQNEFQSPAVDETWNQMSPLLDEALATLGETDRQAVLLRFFENKSLSEVGNSLGAGEDTARKRVSRALEKLHRYFAKRGVTSATATIAEQISANSIHAAPVALAKTVTAVAIAKGAAASISTLTLVKGTLKIMTWIKSKTAIAIGMGILLAGGTMSVTVAEIGKHSVDNSWQAPFCSPEIRNRILPEVRIVPTKFPTYLGWVGWVSNNDMKAWGMGATVSNMIEVAHFGRPARTIFPPALPQGRYDFIANLQTASMESLRKEIEKKFGLVGNFEMRKAAVLLLKVKRPNAPGLKPATGSKSSSESKMGEDINFNQTLSSLAGQIEPDFQIPIIDQTGLSGSFDFDLKWKQPDWQNPNLEELKNALLNQLGLELVPTNMPIEMLVVEKVK